MQHNFNHICGDPSGLGVHLQGGGHISRYNGLGNACTIQRPDWGRFVISAFNFRHNFTDGVYLNS